MIYKKRLKLIKTENGINYYLFKPSLLSLYYNAGNSKHRVEPRHRYSLLHKLHMLWYVMAIPGGYSILYLERDGEVLSYIVFVKANERIVSNCEKKIIILYFCGLIPNIGGKA